MKPHKAKKVKNVFTAGKKPKLKAIIFGSFLAFVVVLLALLWLSQTVFLNDFYTATKRAQIRSVALGVEKNIDSDSLDAYVAKKSSDTDVAIAVIDKRGNVVCSAQNADKMSLMAYIPPEQLKNFYYKARESGGVYEDSFTGFFDKSSQQGASSRQAATYILARVVTDRLSNEYTVVVNARLTPITATVQTVRTILLVITVFVIIFSIALAAVLTKYITKPIVKIADESKFLADSLDRTFTGQGYEEAQYLADSLNYAAAQIGKVEKLRRELVANISHDLRTPLTLISGYAQMMRDLPGEDNEENLQIVIDEADRLQSLVSEVLDMSKLQSGNEQLNQSAFDISAELRDFTGRYNKLVEKDGFEIILTDLCRSDTVVYADITRIRQVVYNLVNNAVSFTGEDKKVYIELSEDPSGIRVDIRDTGSGIGKDELEEIWERYYKSNSHHKRNRRGSGLGLSIVREILELHKAPFGVNSTEGKGSDFYFVLPKHTD